MWGKTILKNIVIYSIIILLIVFSLISIDSHHLCVCEKSKCSTCNRIFIAQSIVIMMILTCTYLSLILLIIYSLTILKKCIFYKISNNTLLNQDVQFNE